MNQPFAIGEFMVRLSRQPYVKPQADYDKISTFFEEVIGTKDRSDKSKVVAVDPKKGGKKK